MEFSSVKEIDDIGFLLEEADGFDEGEVEHFADTVIVLDALVVRHVGHLPSLSLDGLQNSHLPDDVLGELLEDNVCGPRVHGVDEEVPNEPLNEVLSIGQCRVPPCCRFLDDVRELRVRELTCELQFDPVHGGSVESENKLRVECLILLLLDLEQFLGS